MKRAIKNSSGGSMKNLFFTKRPPDSVFQVSSSKKILELSLFILIFFCHLSCTRSVKETSFTSEEKRRYEELFVDLMFYETGIYTLFGEKPITVSLLENSDKKEDPLYIDRSKNTQYILIKSWDLWLEKLKNLPMQNYLFVKKEIKDMPGIYNAFFVNIPATIRVLKEHYPLFKEELGLDFDPETIVYDLQKESSEFWDKAFQIESHISKGLLHGFGKENALKFASLAPDEMDGQLSNILLPYEEISTKNFNLPFFRYFKSPDPILEKYRKDRLKIQEFYQGKDLFDGTLEKLLEK